MEIAQIKITPDYFLKCAMKDYASNIPTVWAREAIQNSSDAGATEIRITITGEYISVKDNGCGMNGDIINNKFLALGGSFKDCENATGGFGKAKEVLCFCWAEWSIDSCPDKKNLYHVDNEMLGVEAIRVEAGSFERGTIIKVKYDSREGDKDTWMYHIRKFVSTCSIKAKVYLNGNILEQLQMRGKKYEYEIATMRVNKSKPTDKVYVRVNGVTMFSRYIYTEISATVTIELKGKSVDMLAANRDSVKYELQEKFERIYKSILTNPKSIEKKADADNIHIDKYQAKELERKWEEIKVTCQPSPSTKQFVEAAITACINGEKTLTESVMEDIKDLDPEVEQKLRLVINGQYTSKMGYSFIVERHNNKVPSLDPDCPKAQQILHVWKLVVDDIVSKDMNYDGKYKVGFTFDPQVRGCCLEFNDPEEGRIKHVLINPTIIKQYKDYKCLGYTLIPVAAHEATHLVLEDHDELFTSYMGTLLGNLGDYKRWEALFARGKKEAAAISKACRA